MKCQRSAPAYLVAFCTKGSAVSGRSALRSAVRGDLVVPSHRTDWVWDPLLLLVPAVGMSCLSNWGTWRLVQRLLRNTWRRTWTWHNIRHSNKNVECCWCCWLFRITTLHFFLETQIKFNSINNVGYWACCWIALCATFCCVFITTEKHNIWIKSIISKIYIIEFKIENKKKYIIFGV